MTPLQTHTRRVLRRWRLIVALAVLGALVGGVWSLLAGSASWTATSALTTQSQTRAPEQDAVLALGYVDYFNQASYQALLRSEAGIPQNVALTATTGATSPILYIEASGADQNAVRSAAAAATARFTQDVHDSLAKQRDQTVADLQRQIDDNTKALLAPGASNDAKDVIRTQIQSLQGRVSDIQSDTTNEVQPLQAEPGVADSSRSPLVDVAAGLVGGALIGVLVALLLSLLDKRLAGAADTGLRLGIDPVIELGPRLSPAERTLRTEQLVNRLSLLRSSESTVIAVAGVRSGATAPVFARELARTCATRRSGALLVIADLRQRGYEGRQGLVEVLDGWATLSSTVLRGGGLDVLPPGSAGAREPYAVIDPAEVVKFLGEAGGAHPLIVIDVPPLLDASESQILCAAADQVLLVVEPHHTTLDDARKALALLTEVNAEVAGVAVVSPGGRAAVAAAMAPVEPAQSGQPGRPGRPVPPPPPAQQAPDQVTAPVEHGQRTERIARPAPQAPEDVPRTERVVRRPAGATESAAAPTSPGLAESDPAPPANGTGSTPARPAAARPGSAPARPASAGSTAAGETPAGNGDEPTAQRAEATEDEGRPRPRPAVNSGAPGSAE